jgi:hypothetical protein
MDETMYTKKESEIEKEAEEERMLQEKYRL